MARRRTLCARSAALLSVVALTLPLALTQSAAADSGPQLVLGLAAGNLTTVMNELGRTPALVNGYYGFVNSRTGTAEPFPSVWAQSVVAMGSTPMITWRPSLPTQDQTSVLTSISEGDEDGYITSWAEAARSVGHPIYLRLMHEFNGTWNPWGAVMAGQTKLPDGTGTYPYSNTPAMFVAAFQHVVNIFQSVGATNVEFVWCPTTGITAGLSSYYPGDAYVSWAAMDGYNRSAGTARSVQSIFAPTYDVIAAITAKPILIAETASVEFSGLPTDPSSKEAWITEGFLTVIPAEFPQVRGVAYFDESRPGHTYAFDSSPSSLQAMQQVAESNLYQAPAL